MSKTSEIQYDIRAQPGPTCPMIDSLIKRINSVEKDMRGHEKLEESELKELLSSIESELFTWRDSVEDGLEKIRRHVEDVRAWGEEWKQLAIKIDDAV